MRESEIIKKLKDLKEFGADPDWKKSNRELLISQIQAQAKPAKPSIGKNVWYGFRATMPTGFKNFMFKPVGAISLMLIMIFGASIFSVSASRGSVPGDVLYKVKLTSEKIYAGLTVDDQKKTDLYIDFAGERLNEVDKLKNEPQKENQNENIKVAIGEFTKQMETVKDQLEKVKAKPKTAEDIVNVAKNVDERVEALSEKINQKQEELKEEYDLVKELREAEDIVDETSDAAIDVIIEKHVSGEVESPVEELTQKIEKKIERAEEEIVETRQEFDQLKDSVEENIIEQETEDAPTESVEEVTDVATTEIEVIDEESETVESEPVLDIEQVQDRPQEAQDLINEAKELLAIGDIATAFDKIIEGKQISREVEQQIEDIETQNTIDKEVEINSRIEAESVEDIPVQENITN